MKRWLRLAAGGITLPALVGCGAAREPLVPVARYLAEHPEQAEASWARLAPGTQVTVTPTTGCVEQVVSSPGQRSGDALGPATWKRPSQIFTVVDAVLAPGEQGHLALTVEGENGSLDVLRIPAGKTPTCVAPADSSGGAVASFIGKSLVFKPTRSACRRLEAVGPASHVVLSSGTPIVFRELTTAPARATGEGAASTWLQGDDLRVRADVVATCFVEAEDASDSEGPTKEEKRSSSRSRFSIGQPVAAFERPSALALLHLSSKACKTEETTAGEHVECTTPVGVWQGVNKDDAVSLRLVRRTVGSVHLLRGMPVDARSFAKTVVAVRFAQAEDPSVEQLQDGMRKETARVLSRDEGVRVASSETDRENLAISIDVGSVRVSELATQTVMVPHEYQDGTRKEANPKKAQAKAAVDSAREGITTAKEQCEEKRQSAREQYQTCMEAAKAAANLANGKTERTIQAGGTAACTILRAAMSTNCSSELAAAREKLAEAQATERETPDTIDVPVMKKTSYPKRVLSRTVTGRVEMTGTLDGVAFAPVGQPFEAKVEDYEVEGDSTKKIPGHRAASPWINDGDRAVPAVAGTMSKWVVSQIRSITGRAALARAKAILRSTGEEVAAGTEALHGLALDVGGERIQGVTNQGTVRPGAAKPVPLAVPHAPKGECVLVVATLPEGSTGKLSLSFGDDVADLRGKSYAHIEVCGASDAPDEKVELISSVEEPVQWAAYRTDGLETKKKANSGNERHLSAYVTPSFRSGALHSGLAVEANVVLVSLSGADESLLSTEGEFSVQAWVAAPGYGVRIGSTTSNSGSVGWRFLVRYDLATFYAGDDSAATAFDMTTMHHVVATHSATARTLYIDGQVVDTEEAPRVTTTGTSFNIAGVNVPNPAAVSVVDEVAVWQRVLSLEEIRALYNDGAGYSLYSER